MAGSSSHLMDQDTRSVVDETSYHELVGSLEENLNPTYTGGYLQPVPE